MFFELDPFKLVMVFDAYERKYGGGSRKYAEAAFAKWRSGDVKMSGKVSERLVCIVPAFVDFDEKYQLIEKLWTGFRQKSTLTVRISPQGGLDSAIASVMSAIDALEEQEVPPAVARAPRVVVSE